jgi:predicted amidohydrolase YtcJ
MKSKSTRRIFTNPSTSGLILTNANIITLDPLRPRAEIVVTRDGKIRAVGSKKDLKKFKAEQFKVIDCRGKTVLPGFIDAHCHFLGFAESLVVLNLEPRSNVRSIPHIQVRISRLSNELPLGTWIRGRGYNEFYLAEKRHPTRWDLDAAAALHPVRLTHRSGRAHVLNSLALKVVGISQGTADPTDGLIDRDVKTGEPTGLLYGMGDYLSTCIPPLDKDQLERGVRLASRKLLSLGITSIHDASPRNNLSRWKMFRGWKKRGFLKPRVSMSFGLGGWGEFPGRDSPFRGDENQIHLAGVKIILHQTTGQMSPSQSRLNEMILDIHRSGFQAIIHAIEETAIGAACSAVEYALQGYPKPDHRHRIEHCSVCTPPMARRLASLGTMVVTQPSFIYFHGDRYLKTVPNGQLKHLYPIGTLMKNGVTVAASSDCPIVPANPLIGIYSAICRTTEAGEAILPQEGIPPFEALRMYGDYAAQTTFEENFKGSIMPGKVADLVILSGDPTELPPNEIKDIGVEMTILNGEVVWDTMA